MWPGTASAGGWRSPQASAGTHNNTRELAQIDKKKPQLITVGASVLVEQTRIVKLLVEKVIVSPNDLEVRLRANGIERLVLELRPEPVEQQAEALV